MSLQNEGINILPRRGKKRKPANLYKIRVTEFVKSGGMELIYYTWAFTTKQAKRNIRIRFNIDYNRAIESWVEMDEPELVKK